MRNLIKINDRFTFPQVLDIPNYDSYELFGVLVHSGTAYFGHYYAFLRPTPALEWFKFNDSSVTPATEHEAIADNFGDGVSSSSAYLLIYLRKASIPDLFTESAPSPVFSEADGADQEEETTDNYRVPLVSDADLIHECSELGVNTSRNSGIFCVPKGSATRTDYVERALRFVKVGKGEVLNVWSLDPVELIKFPRSSFTASAFLKVGESELSRARTWCS
jgi:hypothetical protein